MAPSPVWPVEFDTWTVICAGSVVTALTSSPEPAAGAGSGASVVVDSGVAVADSGVPGTGVLSAFFSPGNGLSLMIESNRASMSSSRGTSLP